MDIAALNAANSVSSTSTKSTESQKATKGLSDNYTMFLKLLTTQLQYQDPTNPTDSTTFTQQLVSYSQVEQQIKTNDQLTSLLDTTKNGAANNASLLNYLGRYVELDGKSLSLQKGTATGSYELSAPAKKVTLEILNEDGAIVASFNGPTTTGNHKIAWDGKDNSGKSLPDGLYTMNIVATDARGATIGLKKQSTIGLVTGIERTDKGNILNLGKLQIDESKILNIFNSLNDSAA
jgi:flagellar basal-body rod modification protein FlgD